MPKYSIDDDHEWADEKDPNEDEEWPRTYVEGHDVEVVYQYGDDPMWDKRKYRVHISGTDDGFEPWISFAVPHRWKGNFWREHLNDDGHRKMIEFDEIPVPVVRRVAAMLGMDADDYRELDPEWRIDR